ncbi:MAG: hydrogenase maturation nickel metallochaperone HypA [Acidobacteriota bacterium]|nr:hydrogenase maturation nickel metallochaperone HypA [Acidobacteriota bacterium]MDQ7086418.1 hydrogenase maturation nickel metallochaperone HypA [Acidobacteriota bacterium]
MHELSVATAMVEQLEQAACREGACRVLVVELALGGLSGVEREPLEFCFPLAAEGTLLEGAELRVREVPVEVECPRCGARTRPEAPGLTCRNCGESRTRVVGGREMQVTSMEIE